MSLLTIATLAAAAASDTLVGSGYVCTTTETAVSEGVLLTPEAGCGGDQQVWVFGPELKRHVQAAGEGPVEVWGYQRAGVRTGLRVTLAPR